MTSVGSTFRKAWEETRGPVRRILVPDVTPSEGAPPVVKPPDGFDILTTCTISKGGITLVVQGDTVPKPFHSVAIRNIVLKNSPDMDLAVAWAKQTIEASLEAIAHGVLHWIEIPPWIVGAKPHYRAVAPGRDFVVQAGSSELWVGSVQGFDAQPRLTPDGVKQQLEHWYGWFPRTTCR